MRLITLTILFSFLMISCNKVNIPKSINKTQELLKAEKFKEAEETIIPCLDAGKNNPRILILQALALAGQEKAEETSLVIDQALALLEGSDDSEALTHLGQAYIKIGKFKEAQGLLEQSIKKDPKNAYTAAILIEAEMKGAKSLRQFALKNKHLKLAEKFPELRNSINYLNLKAITNALGLSFSREYVIQTLQKAYNKEKNNPAVLLNLAYIYDQVEQIPGRATKYYELYLTAVKLLPPEKTQADKVKRRLTYLRQR